jgi:hypothetical protein
MNVLSSPITTTVGASGIVSALVDILYYAVTQHIVTPNLQADVSVIFAGVTAVLAKDFNAK